MHAQSLGLCLLAALENHRRSAEILHRGPPQLGVHSPVQCNGRRHEGCDERRGEQQ